MDDRYFDDLARTTANSTTRRSVLRILTGAGLGVLGGWLAPAGAAAGCVRLGQRCERGDRCCGGSRCARGRCRCPAAAKDCGRVCAECCDDADCGGNVCRGGACGPCPRGQKPCGGACIPTGTCCDGGDCAGGKECPAPGGTCACPPGQKDCAGTCRECCAPSDCPTGKACVDGSCKAPPTGACPAGRNSCSGIVTCGGAGTTCYCNTTTANATVCTATGIGNFHCDNCATDAGCAARGPDYVCVPLGCTCGGNACVRWCANPQA